MYVKFDLRAKIIIGNS